MTELRSRVLFGSIGIVIVIVFLCLSSFSWFHPIFGIGLAVLACVAIGEFYRLAHGRGFKPACSLGIAGSVVYLLARYAWIEWLPSFSILPAAALMLAVLAFFLQFLIRREGAIGNLAVSVLGLIYVAVPLGFVLDILYGFEQRGLCWLILILVVTVVTDMAAYFTGRWIGRVRLWPSVSPGKTVEGTLGGALIGILVGCLMVWICLPMLPLPEMVLLVVLLPILGQLADLFESLLKRDADAKDSGFLPGLGGVLDVVDSLLFTVPLAYVLHRLFLAGGAA